jgi:hypothetical protein
VRPIWVAHPPTHLASVADAVDDLAARPPSGLPVAIGGIGYAKPPAPGPGRGDVGRS